MCLEFCEGHFDGVKVWAVGRQEEEPSAAFLKDGAGLLAFVAGEIVEDDDIAWRKGWRELGFDVGFEDTAVHGLIDDPRRGQAIAAQGGDEGLRFPMAERRMRLQTLAAQCPPAQAGHFGGRSRLVNEQQPVRFLAHPGLTVFTPDLAFARYVSAFTLGRQQRFF